MIVIDDAAIGADRNIDTGLAEPFISRLRYGLNSGCLSAADALGFTGDADGAAADTDLDEVCTGLRQIVEAVFIDDVAGTDLDRVAVLGTDPVNRFLLPDRIAVRRVDDQNIDTSLDQSRYTFLIVTRIDAGTDDIALLIVEDLVRIFLVRIIVFAEHEIEQMIVFIHNRKLVQLVLPNDVVASRQIIAQMADNQLFARRHEFADRLIRIYMADAIVAARQHAQQPAVCRTIIGNSHRTVTSLIKKIQHLGNRRIRADIGITRNKASLIIFDTGDHGCLRRNRLRSVDEGYAAFFCQRNCKLIVRYRLHNRRNHRDVKLQRRFLSLAETDKRRLQ